MKITYLITGSGGSFYCGNCYRDMIYLRAIRKVPETKASAFSLYLPADIAHSEPELDGNIFFGAISMYLREKIPGMRNMPSFIERIVDSKPMLKLAARFAGTTRTEGLEEMTLDMISGEKAFPEKELQRLREHLSGGNKPDIIHLSNALILGLAHHLRKEMNVKVVCSLLNEDDWINMMAEPYQGEAWRLIARESAHVDAFLTPSNYYRDLFIRKTGYSGKNIHVVPLGINLTGLDELARIENWPAIGYFSRINHQNGFDKLVDAFIIIRKKDSIPGLTLHVSGGYTNDDKDFVNAQVRKIKKAGLKNDFHFYPDFSDNGKRDFFSRIDLMCVPVRKHDGYGLYLLEANSAAVPVLQPLTGAFPEIIARTGGGFTYSPDTVEVLAEAIINTMSERKKLVGKGLDGRNGVKEFLSLNRMSEDLSVVYNKVLNGNG